MKIAYISDIHFGEDTCTSEFAVPGETPKDQSETVDFLKGLVEIINENEATYLIIGGDLTSTGSPQEFYYCEQKILELATQCGINSDNIIYTLGNHDMNWNIANLYKSKTKNKGLISEKYRQIAAHAPLIIMDQLPQNHDFHNMPGCGVVEKEHFIIFILNSSSYCTNEQSYSHGKIGKDQLDWFQSEVIRYESDRRTKIVLLHHHPFNYPYPVVSADISLLEEGSEVVSIAGAYGVNLFLHGHRHHPKAITKIESGWKNNITFICAGSLSVNCQQRNKGSIPNTAHIIDLSNAPDSFILKTYEYSLSRGWVALNNNREETPLDPIMYLGKLYNKDELETIIQNLPDPDKTITTLNYDKLPEELKYCSYETLNNYITEVLSSEYDIIGSFPDKTSLIKKEGAY